MEAENEVAAPQVLSPRSKKRKATKDAKEAAKLKDPVAYRAKRAEQDFLPGASVLPCIAFPQRQYDK